MSATKKPYSSPATPYEKLDAVLNEKALRKAAQRHSDISTFQRFAESEANVDAGRFVAVNKSSVVGAKPVPEYPTQSAEQWSNQAALVGVEPPYDGDMSAPVVGETWEIEASIEAAAPTSATGHLPPEAEVVSAMGETAPVEPSCPNARARQLPRLNVSSLPTTKQPNPTNKRKGPVGD